MYSNSKLGARLEQSANTILEESKILHVKANVIAKYDSNLAMELHRIANKAEDTAYLINSIDVQLDEFRFGGECE